MIFLLADIMVLLLNVEINLIHFQAVLLTQLSVFLYISDNVSWYVDTVNYEISVLKNSLDCIMWRISSSVTHIDNLENNF